MSGEPLVSVSEDPTEPGEVVFRVHGGLEEFLAERGHEGRDKVLLGLAHLICEVRRRHAEAEAGSDDPGTRNAGKWARLEAESRAEERAEEAGE
jgi:hypothetical protein